MPCLNRQTQLLGDKIESALERLGITSEKVSKLLGRQCKCGERRDLLNQLHVWLLRLDTDKENSEKYLAEIINDYSS